MVQLVRGLLLLLCLASLGALAVVVWVATQRIGMAHDLEWMEGSMVDHTWRVLHGLPIYNAPSVDHVAYLYTPLYWWLCAVASLGLGEGWLTCRLVNLIAFAGVTATLMGLVYSAFPQREGVRPKFAPCVAAGLFLACYGVTDSWFDLARNDGVFLLFVVGAAWLALRPRSAQRSVNVKLGIAAGITLLLAFLGKQTAIACVPVTVVAAAFISMRRAMWILGTAVFAIVVTTAIYSWLTDGWFWFFVFHMPSGHHLDPELAAVFGSSDLPRAIPSVLAGIVLLCVASRIQAAPARVNDASEQTRRNAPTRRAWSLVAWAAGMLAVSFVTRCHVGGHVNTLLPMYLGSAVLSGALLLAVRERPRLFVVACLLALAQFAVLVKDPRPFLPSERQQEAQRELAALMQEQDGRATWAPAHGGLNRAAGAPPMSHAMAIGDVYRSGVPSPANPDPDPWSREVWFGLQTSIAESLASQRFSRIVLDDVFTSILAPAPETGYVMVSPPPYTDISALGLPVGLAILPIRVFERRP